MAKKKSSKQPITGTPSPVAGREVRLETSGIDGAKIRQLQKSVLQWFAENSRDLPWRRTRDRYHVWISEIMLQQTQVATVIDYWNRFVARFPTVKKLANANQEDVLKLWEGLGYYRRARQLHAAAQVIAETHGGQFPTQFESVLALPGVGRYTAGAILSIADDQSLPILEGNTIRLYARLIGMETDPTTTVNQKRLWAFAEQILPLEKPGAFNQGLMEIGGQICKPKNPSCLICPLNSLCVTYRTGKQELIPAPKTKKVQYEDRHECLVLLQKGQKFLCRQSQAGERWAGLWDFVRLDLTEAILWQEHRALWNSKESRDRDARLHWLEQQVAQLTGLTTELRFGEWSIRHGVTRFRIQLGSAFGRNIRGKLSKRGEYVWLNRQQLQDLPFNVTARKFISQHSASFSQ